MEGSRWEKDMILKRLLVGRPHPLLQLGDQVIHEEDNKALVWDLWVKGRGWD